MLPGLPFYINLLFILTTLLTVFIFYRAAGKRTIILLSFSAWLVLQGILGLSGFYLVTDSIPPRVLFSAVIMIAVIVLIFTHPRGKQTAADADLRLLTIIHIVRIPVELLLHTLYLEKALPKIMTYEGNNFDILAGMTAPIIYYCVFIKKNIGRRGLLVWNLLCLALLINIVVTAILSAPFPFQQLGFEQPNIAILYFPFVWLPFGIVFLVLLSHLISISRLAKGEHPVFRRLRN